MSFDFKRYRRDYLQIVRLGFPVLISQVGMIVVGFADNIMVGHYSTDALASASFVNNIFNLPLLAALGFGYGLTPLVGALFTNGSPQRIGALLRAGVRVNIMAGLILTALMALLYPFLDLLGQPSRLLPHIRPYYLIVMAALVPVVIFNAFAQWSYGIRNTAMPMWILLGCNALNILGNYLLIFGHGGCPELGLVGAGISTLTARLLSGVVIAAIFFYRKRFRSYVEGWRLKLPRRADYRSIVHMSLPVSLQMSFETAAFSGCAVMCGWLGVVDLAAYQIIITVGTLGFCLYYAIGSAIAIVVANEAGAGDRRAMRRKAMAGYGVMMTCCLASSLFFLLGSRGLMELFTENEEVIIAATAVIIPLVLYQTADATQINFANALRGAGDVKPMMWIAFLSYIIVGLPSTYLIAFTLGWGLYGVVLSFSVSLLLAAGLYGWRFFRATRR